MNADEKASTPRRRWDRRYAARSSAGGKKPTAFVAACLPKLPTQGRALDVAAGAGRHTIPLAERGLIVDAIDISWQGLQLTRQRSLAVGLTPGEQVHFVVADIERPWLPDRSYQVILVSRFLYHPLFPWITERLACGGWLIYETFLKPASGTGDQFMRPEFLLEPDELKDAFSHFEILHYDERRNQEKPTAQLLARKPLQQSGDE